MEIILLSDIEKLGFQDDVVKVKNGYARNFLIPKGMAQINNKSNNILLLERLKRREKLEAKQMASLNDIMSKLSETKLTIGSKVGSNNKIFGSVSILAIGNKLKDNGIDIDKRKLSIKEGEIKVIGNYTCIATLTKDHIVEFPLEVVAE